MTTPFKKSCDVLIIGAGMAGGLLARQLTVEQPDLRIIIVDRKTDFDWWVGESTVEVFDDYAVRNCRLGPYLAANHIVKHGLRFWFDSEDKDLRMCELSEQGRSRYTTLNRGVQLDRARLDRDLCEINRRHGVEVLLGTQVLARGDDGGPGIVIDADGGHVVHTSGGTIRCRHLVDAGGRSSPLARQLDLVPSGGEDRAPVGSYWGRFQGTRSIIDVPRISAPANLVVGDAVQDLMQGTNGPCSGKLWQPHDIQEYIGIAFGQDHRFAGPGKTSVKENKPCLGMGPQQGNQLHGLSPVEHAPVSMEITGVDLYRELIICCPFGNI